MEPISLGLTALSAGSSVLGGLFGSQRNANQNQSWYAMAQAMVDSQQNELRQRQMNLDATRRKRDIVRQAQVATAQAENTAANGGALNSSGIEGARAAISGQAGVNTLGVSQNQEIANMAFGIEGRRMQMGMQAGYQRASQRSNFWDMLSMVGSGFQGQNAEKAAKLGQWGYGVISGV